MILNPEVVNWKVSPTHPVAVGPVGAERGLLARFVATFGVTLIPYLCFDLNTLPPRAGSLVPSSGANVVHVSGFALALVSAPAPGTRRTCGWEPRGLDAS